MALFGEPVICSRQRQSDHFFLRLAGAVSG